MSNNIPKIVILGAGYAGILAAQRLQKELNYNEAEVKLVNKHDYHYITTHLHMPAAGTDNPENARVEVSKLIDEFKIEFVKSTVIQIVPAEQKVVLEDGTLSYDYLVIGLGGEPQTFGIPGMSEYAMNIRSLNSVRHIREHIEYQFARFKREPHRTDYLTFVIGGAGFTGIEFAGELADRVPQLCREFDVDRNLVNIVVVEAMPSVLPGFDADLVEYAQKVLEKKGVQFRLSTAVKECTPNGVIVGDNNEEIKAATVVWVAGVRGSRLIEETIIENKQGRVMIDDTLRAPGFDNIYVLGDNSVMINPETGRPYPPTGQIAMQQGELAALNLVAQIRGKQLKNFKFSNKGTVASLGKNEGVGVAFGKKFTGFIASVLKKIVDLRYLFIIGGVSLVLRKGKFF